MKRDRDIRQLQQILMMRRLVAYLLVLRYNKTDPKGLASESGSRQKYSCISTCLQGLLKDKWNEFKCCTAKAGIAGVTVGTVTCTVIVAFEPYLLPTYPACAGLASSSSTIIGVGLCMTRVEVGGLASVAGCIAGCSGW
mgnify:CR=1 FL=1